MNPNAVLFGMLTGSRIDQYHLKSLLGTGGFGGVFLADEVVRNKKIRDVAIKVIISDRTDAQLNELIAATTLRHQHLLEAHSAGECKLLGYEFIYLVMELASDGLQKRLTQSQLSVAETKQLVTAVAEVLRFLHDSNRKVHRDLKPANILRVGSTWKLSDLGLIRDMGANSYINTSNTMGTVAYMPPEMFQSNHTVSFGWDTWSLGITIIESLTGRIPYENFQTIEQLIVKVSNCDIRIPRLPAPFDEIVQGCLQKNYRQRWTASQVLDALSSRGSGIFGTPFTPSPAQAISQPRVQSRDLVLTLPKNQKLELVEIPSGRLVMKGGHEIRLNGFRMGKYPITQGQYEAVMGNNPSHFKGNARCPVENVSWNDAVEFCQKVSQQTGQQVRLPSETEWEYACRAGTTTRYYFGDNENELDRYGWHCKNSGSKTHPVGEKQPNGWGLYDMHGNVWEWCADTWHSNYKGAPEDGSAWIERNETSHLLRGGSWDYYPDDCRSACRNFKGAGFRNDDLGFRVACLARGLL